MVSISILLNKRNFLNKNNTAFSLRFLVKLYRLALSRCSWRMFFKLLNPKTRDQDESCLTSTQWYKTLWLEMMFLDCFLYFMNNF